MQVKKHGGYYIRLSNPAALLYNVGGKCSIRGSTGPGEQDSEAAGQE
jgi:hypothetical protein